MKKHLRASLAAVIGALVLAVAFLVGRSLWQQHSRELAQHGLEFLPGVSQHMTDFHRVKLQNGRKVWEVSARDAQYFEEDRTVVVRDASMELFLKDGRPIGLKGNEARILLDGREVAQVELSGDIRMSLADYVVHTQRATYDHTRQRISAPGAVEISSHALDLHGESLEADVETQRVWLRQRISMHVQPAALQEGGHDAPL